MLNMLAFAIIVLATVLVITVGMLIGEFLMWAIGALDEDDGADDGWWP